MTRLEELNILIPKLNSELVTLVPHKDGSGLIDIAKKVKEIRDYQIERYKLVNPNNKIIPDYLKNIKIDEIKDI